MNDRPVTPALAAREPFGATNEPVPAATKLRHRVAALWGAEVADRMVDVEDVRGTIQVSGLAERPADVGTASRRTFVTVNGRPLRTLMIGEMLHPLMIPFRMLLPPR